MKIVLKNSKMVFSTFKGKVENYTLTAADYTTPAYINAGTNTVGESLVYDTNNAGDYFVSKPFLVKAGDTLDVSNICGVSVSYVTETSPSMSYFKSLGLGYTSGNNRDARTFSFTATNDTYVCLCGRTYRMPIISGFTID